MRSAAPQEGGATPSRRAALGHAPAREPWEDAAALRRKKPVFVILNGLFFVKITSRGCGERGDRRREHAVEISNNGAHYRGAKLIFCICRDITSRKKAEKEREDLIKRLQESLAEIRTLRKILPLCSFCKKVRDDKGYWEQVDVYLHKHSSVDVSHGICPECMKKHYPDEYRALLPGRVISKKRGARPANSPVGVRASGS